MIMTYSGDVVMSIDTPMHVFIMSRGRAGKVKTLDNMPEEWKKRHTTLIVPESEVETYSRAYPDADIWGRSSEATTLPKARRWLVNRVGTGKIVMMDDDLEFYERYEGSTRLKNKGDYDVRDVAGRMLVELAGFLDDHVHAGVSGREGQNRVTADFVRCTRMSRVLAYRLDGLPKIAWDRVDDMEDFDITLQLLRLGQQNIVSYRFAQGQGSSSEEGGCSMYRTPQLHTETAQRLADLHPGFVRVVKKDARNWKGFGGTRTDVVVSWKKAYESSQKFGS